MKILLYILVALLVLSVAAAVYVRFAPVNAADWHLDPEQVTPSTSPNFVLLAGPNAVTVAAPALVVAGRLQATAEAEGARVVAGSLDEGFVTFVVRSRLMGYPDFITIRLVPEEEVTRLHIFSRSRYGHSDLGVNTARVRRWLVAAGDETGTT